MGEPVRYAGFVVRGLAFLLDISFLWSLKVILIDTVLDPSGLTAQMSLVLMISLYFFLLTSLFGQTIGKMIMGIKVVHPLTDKPAWEDVLLREVIGKVSSVLILFVGLFMIAVHPRKQALHDRLSGLCVVWDDPLLTENNGGR
ncbi:putative membrane protein YteJ [Insulibacter thermoxylanivorax]|uniref:Membrane protein YteJ n=1 Tax=Insulibacter thermoxylanivorax TaxID=2749268 RepID=A0A916QHK7_9BACL|nr:RDD family protein [Insulibacter thermoxylanivorax]GFR38994.1 putative membrane protein YteJ [Insulibacter thermoxylanivorax]